MCIRDRTQAKSAGYDVKVSKFPLSANGKALAEGETLGFVKIISETQYGEILGTHIMASHATDMISEAIMSMQIEGTVYDLSLIHIYHLRYAQNAVLG